MGKFISSSIGKKLLMSVTGLFLISFLFIHLGVNLLLLVPVFNPEDAGEVFNLAAHFMATNPAIRIIEPVLMIGFLIHIIYSTTLTLQNQKARPVKYAVVSQGTNSPWASRNMFILGGTVLAFLVLHLANFYYHIKLETDVLTTTTIDGEKMHDTYTLVFEKFKCLWVVIAYAIGGIMLGLHLSHGFWSAFQTIGWSNDIWRKRLETIGVILAIIFGGGFTIIPIIVYLTA